jgi:hypothetical protein
MKKDRKNIRKATYTIEFEYTDNGTQLTRTNDGFNPLELIGLLQISIDDVMKQFKGEIQPDIVKRKVIQD